MKWFKFYGQDYLSDPKMLALSASERSCWITLLSYSSVNDNGMITFLSEQQLMLQAGLDFTCEEWGRTSGILEKLKSLKMIEIDNGMITISNWNKRQGESLTGYQRVKKYREKKKLKDNADNTSDNKKITIEENRIEENRRIEKNSDVPSQDIQSFIDSFKEVNPSYDRLFANKTERGSSTRLLRKYGLEKMLATTRNLKNIISQPYSPRITTPYELEKNLGKLLAFVEQNKNIIRNKKPIVHI